MDQYEEDLFEAVADIVAATMEGNTVSIDAKGGAQVAAYFRALYEGLAEKPEAAPCDGKFEITKDQKGEYRFSLKAGNGEVIAVSEGYKKKASCLKGIESVRANAAGAAIVSPTAKKPKSEPEAPAPEAEEPSD